jgi:hypothetical protein
LEKGFFDELLACESLAPVQQIALYLDWAKDGSIFTGPPEHKSNRNDNINRRNINTTQNLTPVERIAHKHTYTRTNTASQKHHILSSPLKNNKTWEGFEGSGMP